MIITLLKSLFSLFDEQIIDPKSIFSPQKLAQVKQWLLDSGELYVFIQHAYAAGLESHCLFTDFDAYQSILHSLNPSDEVFVFKKRQLPYRGHANEFFLEEILKKIEDTQEQKGEWLIMEQEFNKLSGGVSLDKDADCILDEIIEDFWDQDIAIGPTPPWREKDNENICYGRAPMKGKSLV